MGKFMIAHLANGGPLLNSATAQLMHGRQWNPYSALPGMALGFYHEDRNGLNIVGHGGDTIFMHSDLHLFLDRNVGLFVSMNSAGKNAAVHPLREQLFEGFTDRYFPRPVPNIPTATTALAQGQALSGHYVSSRAGSNNFTRMLSLLGETTVAVDQDGILTASTVTDSSGAPRRWREVGPWLWQEVNGSDELQAIVDRNNQVRMFSITPYAPIIEFLPAPASLDAGWILPVGGAVLVVLIIAALGWPIVALTRRRFRYRSDLSGRPLQLHRATRVTSWLYLIVVVGWVLILADVNKDLTALNGGLDFWMRLLQLVLIAAIVGTLFAIWNAFTVTTAAGHHLVATVWAIVIAVATALMAWLCVNAGLLTASLNY